MADQRLEDVVMPSWVGDVHAFWFGGPVPASGMVSEACRTRWFKKDPAFDQEVARRFGSLMDALQAGEHQDVLVAPSGRLSTLLVLDQYRRNVYRDQPEAFACDTMALRVAAEGVALGHDQALAPLERAFMYLPFEHSEDARWQAFSVALFTELLRVAPPEHRDYFEVLLDYAERHRVVIDRFGRFPHRNAVLGRSSTEEEVAFLAQPGSSF